jgi:hypothetical protein
MQSLYLQQGIAQRNFQKCLNQQVSQTYSVVLTNKQLLEASQIEPTQHFIEKVLFHVYIQRQDNHLLIKNNYLIIMMTKIV